MCGIILHVSEKMCDMNTHIPPEILKSLSAVKSYADVEALMADPKPDPAKIGAIMFGLSEAQASKMQFQAIYQTDDKGKNTRMIGVMGMLKTDDMALSGTEKHGRLPDTYYAITAPDVTMVITGEKILSKDETSAYSFNTIKFTDTNGKEISTNIRTNGFYINQDDPKQFYNAALGLVAERIQNFNKDYYEKEIDGKGVGHVLPYQHRSPSNQTYTHLTSVSNNPLPFKCVNLAQNLAGVPTYGGQPLPLDVKIHGDHVPYINVPQDTDKYHVLPLYVAHEDPTRKLYSEKYISIGGKKLQEIEKELDIYPSRDEKIIKNIDEFFTKNTDQEDKYLGSVLRLFQSKFISGELQHNDKLKEQIKAGKVDVFALIPNDNSPATRNSVYVQAFKILEDIENALAHPQQRPQKNFTQR